MQKQVSCPVKKPLSQKELNRAFLAASLKSDFTETDMLLRTGANIEATGRFGVTALMNAAGNQKPGVCRRLLRNGANPNARDDSGRTPVMYAAITGRTENCKTLVRFGADVWLADCKATTASMFAEKTFNFETMLFLKSVEQRKTGPN
jgi:ankyrin repeat protein